MRLSTKVIEEEMERSKLSGLKDRVIWDDTIIGLGARISPKGKASFILKYSFQGQPRKLTMGKFGRVSLNQARDQARVLFGEMMKGVDPVAKKAKIRGAIAVKDLCKLYIERHACKKKSGHQDVLKIERYIIPRLGSKKIAAVTYTDILDFHQSIDAKIMANRCLVLVSKMFALAKEWALVEPTFVNPATGIKKHPEKSRTRYVREDEMPRLLEHINAVEDPYIRGTMLISLFTGIRQGSIVSLKWSDVDLNACLLFERDAKTSKAGEVFTHTLSQAAIDVFKSTPRRENDPFIFRNGRQAKRAANAVWFEWQKVKKNADILESEGNRLWIHDLRRTVGSWLVKNNYSTNVAKAALNHKSLVAAQRYQHISDGDIVKRAMEDITQKMISTTKVPTPPVS